MHGATQKKIVGWQARTIALAVLLCFVTVSLFAAIVLNHDDHDEYGHSAVECATCALIFQLKQIGIACCVAQFAFYCFAISIALPRVVIRFAGFLTPIELKVRINN